MYLSEKGFHFLVHSALLIFFLSGSVSAEHPDSILKHLPEGSTVTASKEAVNKKGSYRVIRYLHPETGHPKEIAVDRQGNLVDVDATGHSSPALVRDRTLAKALTERGNGDETFNVLIVLKTPVLSEPLKSETGSAAIGNTRVTVQANGQKLDHFNVDRAYRSRLRDRNERAKKLESARKALVNRFINRNQLQGLSGIHEQADQGMPTLALTLTKRQINRIIKKSHDLIDGIEINRAPAAMLTEALVSTGVDPLAVYNPNRSGAGVGIYMVEHNGHCPEDDYITNYTRLGGPTSNHSEGVANVLRRASPASHIYCADTTTTPPLSYLDGFDANPPVHIVNISIGWSNPNNVYTSIDRDWDNLAYNHGLLVFSSAGNNGEHLRVSPPAAGLNTIAVGSYNHRNHTVSGFSRALNPTLGNQKPDLLAPGEGIFLKPYSPQSLATGTSFSSPHAAAFAADTISNYTWMKLMPDLAKAHLLAGAQRTINGAVNSVGAGGLDFHSTHWNGHFHWWRGDNASFDNFAGSKGYIKVNQYLNATSDNARAVFSWMNRGDYSYATNQIGMDFGLVVYAPNGSVIGSSMSFDNAYEVVNFTPEWTGTYQFRLYRLRNLDVQSKFHATLAISH